MQGFYGLTPVPMKVVVHKHLEHTAYEIVSWTMQSQIHLELAFFFNSGTTVYKIFSICFYHFFIFTRWWLYPIILIKQIYVWNMKKESCVTHLSIFADRPAFSVLAAVYVIYCNLNFYLFLENHKNTKTQHYLKFQCSGDKLLKLQEQSTQWAFWEGKRIEFPLVNWWSVKEGAVFTTLEALDAWTLVLTTEDSNSDLKHKRYSFLVLFYSFSLRDTHKVIANIWGWELVR